MLDPADEVGGLATLSVMEARKRVARTKDLYFFEHIATGNF